MNRLQTAPKYPLLSPLPIENPPRLTPQEYLRIEREAEQKSELRDGVMVEMPGASRRHNLINGNVTVLLKTILRGTVCELYANDMRVRIPFTANYTYPDVVVACTPRFEDGQEDVLTNPVLIIEILSPSTQNYERTGKFDQYRQIPTLQNYVLLSQTAPQTEIFARHSQPEDSDAPDVWVSFQSSGLDAVLTFSILDAVALPLSEIYDGVLFEAAV